MNLSETAAREVAAKLADLTIQAIMFDMDVDIETASLVPKHIDNTPFWVKGWREKDKGSDRAPEDYEGGRDER